MPPLRILSPSEQVADHLKGELFAWTVDEFDSGGAEPRCGNGG